MIRLHHHCSKVSPTLLVLWPCLLVLAVAGCKPHPSNQANSQAAPKTSLNHPDQENPGARDNSGTLTSHTNSTLELSLVSGQKVQPFSDPSTVAAVLVFVSTDCPIANAYHPQLHQLEKEFGPRGVRFFLVHPTPGVAEAEIKAHAAEYELTLPIAIDSAQQLADFLDAKVTPEAFVIAAGSQDTVYRGAIDNVYADYGKKRPQATQSYLRDALDQLLQGQPIAVTETNPVGCFIER